MSSSQYTPIPGPSGVPLLGNIYDIDPETPMHSLELLADTYGTLIPLQISTYKHMPLSQNLQRFS